MSTNDSTTLILMVLATMAILSFWRQILGFLLSLAVVLFCCGVLFVAKMFHT
jgi:uncharacterized membrane protein